MSRVIGRLLDGKGLNADWLSQLGFELCEAQSTEFDQDGAYMPSKSIIY